MKTIIYIAVLATLVALLFAGCVNNNAQGDKQNQAAPSAQAQPQPAGAQPNAQMGAPDLSDPVGGVNAPSGDTIPEDFAKPA